MINSRVVLVAMYMVAVAATVPANKNKDVATVGRSTLLDAFTKVYLFLLIPMRFAVTHWCISPSMPILRVLMALMQRQDNKHRLRYLAHIGTSNCLPCNLFRAD